MQCPICDRDLYRISSSKCLSALYLCVERHFQLMRDTTHDTYKVGAHIFRAGRFNPVLLELVGQAVNRERDRLRLTFLESLNDNDKLFEPRE